MRAAYFNSWGTLLLQYTRSKYHHKYHQYQFLRMKRLESIVVVLLECFTTTVSTVLIHVKVEKSWTFFLLNIFLIRLRRGSKNGTS
jgi:hypothetical protein